MIKQTQPPSSSFKFKSEIFDTPKKPTQQKMYSTINQNIVSTQPSNKIIVNTNDKDKDKGSNYDESQIMSLLTKRSNFAIKSAPNCIQHRKIASRDYFGKSDIDEIIEEEQIGYVGNQDQSAKNKPNQFVNRGGFDGRATELPQLNNNDSEIKPNVQKSVIKKKSDPQKARNFCKVIEKISQHKLSHYFFALQKYSIIKSKTIPTHSQVPLSVKPGPVAPNLSSKIDKSPTFNQNDFIINPQDQNALRLIGKITKQLMITSPKSQSSSKQDNLSFTSSHQGTKISNSANKIVSADENYIPLTNKLLLLQNSPILQIYAQKMTSSYKIDTSVKRFSVANQK